MTWAPRPGDGLHERRSLRPAGLLIGTVSTNPLLFILATWLVLGWRGLDRWVLARFGVTARPAQPSATGPGTVPEPLR